MTSNQKDIIRHFIENDLLNGQHPEPVDNDTDLLLSGILNSLGVVRLAAFVQEEFAVEIPAEDVVIDHFISVDALTTYLQTR